MKKKRNKKYRPRGSSWKAIQIALTAASIESQDNKAHQWLATEAYAALEKLVGGHFTLRDFLLVTKLNAFAYMLAIEVYPSLSDESRETIATQKEAIELAAKALTSIGDRHRKTGKYGASGDELAAIRESFALLDALTGYANRGETVRAMMKADAMVSQSLNQLAKEAA